MELVDGNFESVITNDILATWERQRSSEELQDFIKLRHAELPEFDDIQTL